MTDWSTDKQWSDKFIPFIKRILGEFIISDASFEEDATQNTDLIVLKHDDIRVACRVRRYEYVIRYGYQFTIRYDRPMGTKTEFQKILDGWGTYFFYAFAGKTDDVFEKWFIGDLDVFRTFISGHPDYARHAIENIDNSSRFLSFDCEGIDGFIVHSHGSWSRTSFMKSSDFQCRYPRGEGKTHGILDAVCDWHHEESDPDCQFCKNFQKRQKNKKMR